MRKSKIISIANAASGFAEFTFKGKKARLKYAIITSATLPNASTEYINHAIYIHDSTPTFGIVNAGCIDFNSVNIIISTNGGLAQESRKVYDLFDEIVDDQNVYLAAKNGTGDAVNFGFFLIYEPIK